MQIKPLYIFLLLFLAISCLEPYYPEINDYIDLPVIEGTITNEPGPYSVRLSRSTAILGMEIKPISQAVVKIMDDAGNEETLRETVPGTYVTKAGGIQGVTGRSYKIVVTTRGKTYESDYELLRTPVEIESISHEISREPVKDGYIDGLQFYLNSGEISDPQTNLLWTVKETYIFESEYKLDYIYWGPDSIQENHSDSGFICWRTERLDKSFSWKATGPEMQLKKFPLHFVDVLTRRLSERYSVEVSQYTLSESAYIYWNEIEKLHEETGSLYTRQPYQVKGNLKNTGDTDEVVLGYFMAAGVAKKRIFVNRPSLIFNYNECNPLINLLDVINPNEIKYPVFAMQAGADRAFAPLSCFDCRLKGGTETKPDFWE